MSAALFFSHYPFSGPITTNPSATHYYIAREVAGGSPLYKDIFSDKPPLHDYLLAAPFLLTRGDIIKSIIVSRFIFFFIFLCGAAALFIFSKAVLQKEQLALLSVVSFIGVGFPYFALVGGNKWQLLTSCLGIISVLCYIRMRLFLCGVFAALAAMTWLPGLVFLAGPLIYTVLFEDDRIKKGKILIFGFALPVISIIILLLLQGSLRDCILQTILFGMVSVPVRWLEGPWGNIRDTIVRDYLYNIILILLGVAGYIAGISRMLIWRVSGPRHNQHRANFLALFYLSALILISLANFQQGPDFIPLIPWLCLYAAFLPDGPFALLRRRITGRLLYGVFLLSVAISLYGAVGESPALTLHDQQSGILGRLDRLGVGKADGIFSDRASIYLLFFGKKNIIKYHEPLATHLYKAIERFEAGGFKYILMEIKMRRPKAIIVRATEADEVFPRFREYIEADYALADSYDGRMFYIRK